MTTETAAVKTPKAKKPAKAASKPAPKAATPRAPGEVRWTPRRIAVVTALRQLGATSAGNAKTAGEIHARAVKAKGVPELADAAPYHGHGPKGVYLVKVCLDQYKPAELLATGYAASCKLEGERELRYYLTAKGLKVVMTPPPAKTAK